MNAKIEKVAYIGLRGIDYEEIELGSEVLTALTGPGGAGKSTFATCLGYALLPDKKVLNIQPISEIQDAHAVGLDFLAGLVNPDYRHAYVVLDITTRLDTRLIAGIHISVKEGLGELKKWIIKDAPKDISLHSILSVEDGDSEYYPDLTDLSRNLANRSENPMDLEQLKNVGDYGEALYQAGILPTNLLNSHTRSLYARLIETTFHGGLSRDVSGKLKEYLLPQEPQLSDTVFKLQGCTDQVLQTRHAVKDSDAQLDIIQIVYGNGKDIVTSALGRIAYNLSEGRKKSDALAADMADKEKQVEVVKDKPSLIDEEIKMAEANLKSLQESETARLALLTADADRLSAEFETAKKNEADIFNKMNSFREAEKLWLKLAGENSTQTIEWLKDWFKNEIKNENDKIVENNRLIKQLQTERASLERSSTDIKTKSLAEIVGGLTLDEAFDSLTEDEAIEIELAMGGLTSGVVGCTPEDLSDVSANETLPEVFWIGKEKPTASPIISSGDWFLSARPDGGYTVFSKNRKPVLGVKARRRRKDEIDQEIGKLTGQIEGITKGVSRLQDSRDLLLKNDKEIRFFLENRSSLDRFTQEWLSAKGLKEKTERELKEKKAERNKLQGQIAEIGKPYQSNIAVLKEQKSDAEVRLKGLKKAITELQPQITDAARIVDEYTKKLQQANDVLNSGFDSLLSDSQKLPVVSDMSYSIEQTKRIDAVGNGLKDEPPTRIVALQEADPEDEVSCIRIWPVINDIIRDRVPADVIDNFSEDIVIRMKDKRANLDIQLKQQENQLKI